MLIDASDASIQCLPDATDRLAPAEVLLDALAHRLADGVAAVTRGSSVDGAAAVTRVVGRHVRRDVPLAARVDEVARVVGLVGRDRSGSLARQRVEHRQRCGALAHAVGMRDHSAHHQP